MDSICPVETTLSLIGGKVFEYPGYSDLEAPTSATKQGRKMSTAEPL